MKDAVIQAAISNPTIHAYTLDKEEEVRLAGQQVAVQVGFRTVNAMSLVNRGATLLTVSGQQLSNFFNYLSRGYTGSTYRNVKNDAVWRAIYDVQGTLFEKNHKLHGLMFEYLDATYCRKCRIKMPLRNLTIDHQKPQVGGRTAAILKIFRGLGLTVGGPRGNKNIQAVGALAANVGGNTTLPVGAWSDRNTLNNVGVIYYSAIREARQIAQLEETCMHHYLNLSPVCGSCNSSMSNHF